MGDVLPLYVCAYKNLKNKKQMEYNVENPTSIEKEFISTLLKVAIFNFYNTLKDVSSKSNADKEVLQLMDKLIEEIKAIYK